MHGRKSQYEFVRFMSIHHLGRNYQRNERTKIGVPPQKRWKPYIIKNIVNSWYDNHASQNDSECLYEYKNLNLWLAAFQMCFLCFISLLLKLYTFSFQSFFFLIFNFICKADRTNLLIRVHKKTRKKNEINSNASVAATRKSTQKNKEVCY